MIFKMYWWKVILFLYLKWKCKYHLSSPLGIYFRINLSIKVINFWRHLLPLSSLLLLSIHITLCKGVILLLINLFSKLMSGVSIPSLFSPLCLLSIKYCVRHWRFSFCKSKINIISSLKNFTCIQASKFFCFVFVLLILLFTLSNFFLPVYFPVLRRYLTLPQGCKTQVSLVVKVQESRLMKLMKLNLVTLLVPS